MTRRGWIAIGCLLLTAAGCSRPTVSPLPTVIPSVASASPTAPSPTPSATPTAPGATASTTPTSTPVTTPRPTPSATTTAPPAVQRFALDQAAEFDDGLIIEIAGSVADKAKKTDKGAAATKSQIVIASVRIENGTKHTYDAAAVHITASYGNGTSAELIVDKTGELQAGFAGKVKPNDESIATVGFAVPDAQLKHVTFIVDPSDAEHDPVSFTGKVRRL
jgi:hypothetical protein